MRRFFSLSRYSWPQPMLLLIPGTAGQVCSTFTNSPTGCSLRPLRRRTALLGVEKMIPGEMKVVAGELELNARRKTFSIAVTNTGDRPIQVGSHYHFFETNAALQFDRKKAYGRRLNIAGTAVRFEPGQTRTVELVALVGDRKVYGFTGKVMGKLK